ncbi:MAG: hypothetical protein J6C75_07725, partial [Oscillospiraceae bacterium]|nr:hypothetical protein [Oscillospiraceae bacterium]
MKKFFALALAAAMVMSLASAAFAADILDDAAFDKPLDYSGDADNLKYNKTYDPDWSSTTNNSIKLGNMIEYGDTAYYPLVEVSGPNAGPMTNYKQVEKLKIKAEFEMGEDLVESISIVKKPIAAVDGQDSAFALDLSEAVNIADFIVINEGAPVINAVWTGGPNINDINVSVIPY